MDFKEQLLKMSRWADQVDFVSTVASMELIKNEPNRYSMTSIARVNIVWYLGRGRCHEPGAIY